MIDWELYIEGKQSSDQKVRVRVRLDNSFKVK